MFVQPDGSPYSSAISSSYTTPTGTTAKRLVTPAVQREARRHGGCPALPGAALEDNAPGAHWEMLHYAVSPLIA
jgi:hypothetical protein